MRLCARAMRLVCTLLLAPPVSGHAILMEISGAYPRIGISGTTGTGAGIGGSGTKLRPFTDAAMYADETKCGGAGANNDPGVQRPLQAFSPGDELTVTWKMTIAHPADYVDSPGSGVRIAMHYGAGDSFKENILAGGLVGDPGVSTLAAGDDPGTESGDLVTKTVTLPAGKTCDYCTLQWIWAANGDGGSYLMCADISITDDGRLPNFSAVPDEVGKLVAGVLAPPLPPGVVASPPPAGQTGGVSLGGSDSQQADGGGGGAAGPVIGVIVGLAAVGGLVYWYTKVRGKAAGPGAPPASGGVVPPPPPQQPPSDLPPGWQEAKDPSTGVTYFFNPTTLETQWTKP